MAYVLRSNHVTDPTSTRLARPPAGIVGNEPTMIHRLIALSSALLLVCTSTPSPMPRPTSSALVAAPRSTHSPTTRVRGVLRSHRNWPKLAMRMLASHRPCWAR